METNPSIAKKSFWKSPFFIGTLLFLFIAIGAFCWVGMGSYSKGYRAGTVYKISQKGIIFKTYEGQLNLGMGIRDVDAQHNSVQTSNTFDFSVESEEVVKKLEDASLKGSRVDLHYQEKYIKLFWRGDTEYIVDEVRTLP